MINSRILNMWDKLPLRDQERVAQLIELLYRKESEPMVEEDRTEFCIEDLPLFGMWADREDMKDSVAYVRKLRTQEWG